MSVVNSHNGWDPLEEVIVGDGFPENLPLADFSFRKFFHDNIYGYSHVFDEQQAHQFITKRHIAEHNEDVQAFADKLTELGIIVRRPKVPKIVKTTRTLCWDSQNYPALNVRDQCLIVGDTIIETPPYCRYRYFENDYMKHLFLEYFKGGAKWIQAPRPLMTDNSFDLGYVGKDPETLQVYENLKQKHSHSLDCGLEIMFDAANCMRLGKHILFNAATENERLGVKWLQQILGDQYKIWEVNVADNHIDSLFLPLRPGLALYTVESMIQKFPPEIQKWDLIHVPVLERTKQELDLQAIKLASPKIWVNILSINPNLILCHTQFYEYLSAKLKPYNIEVVPSQIRHCEVFGGAHHCLTLDIRRKSELEDYFA